MAEPYYATVADLRADPAIPDAAPPSDDELLTFLVDAEDRIDRLIGPKRASIVTGRKYDVTVAAGLTDPQRDALKRATIKLVVVAYQDPEAFFEPAGGGRIIGPDFSIQGAKGPAAAAKLALREVHYLLINADLVVRTARAYP